ncbi:MAG: cmx8 [Planctomycetaceae bacterium]|nr:cmx8 [Planctomycetaceae bacterium]
MAKKTVLAESKPNMNTVTEMVEITYDLFDLPTAQHKAGLAGLVLQIQSMNDRRLPKDSIPEVVGEVGTTTVTFRFTEKSVNGLMDDFYDARLVKVEVKSKWPGEPPLEEKLIDEKDDDTGQVKKVKRFVYEVVQPRGHFLEQHLSDGDGLWLKLWRDMLWNVPRSKPTTRGPYNSRADSKPCSESAATWKDLVAFDTARRKGLFKTDSISSALLLGAQALNAESVSFEGRVEQTLLLHFWPLTVLIFVPQVIENDGGNDFVGYSLAIPEVSDLDNFCRDYSSLLGRLPKEPRGYRPLGAVIDLPEQSALEFLQHLGGLADFQAKQGASRKVAASVSSIEYLHLVKLGNNVKSQSAGRIAPSRELMSRYFDIMRRGMYRNPLFRSGLLRSLLDSVREPTPWYASFSDLFQTRPWPLFVCCDKTPRNLPWFANDAAAQFDSIADDFKQSLEAFQSQQRTSLENRLMTDDAVTPNDDKPKPQLETLIYGLVRTYVNRKTEDRSKLKWDDIAKRPRLKDDKTGRERLDIPKDYSDAREKVVSDVFLAMRSRREQDFVDYFTATICSVGQYLPPDDFPTVALALIREPETVKTITLLALSANS